MRWERVEQGGLPLGVVGRVARIPFFSGSVPLEVGAVQAVIGAPMLCQVSPVAPGVGVRLRLIRVPEGAEPQAKATRVQLVREMRGRLRISRVAAVEGPVVWGQMAHLV